MGPGATSEFPEMLERVDLALEEPSKGGLASKLTWALGCFPEEVEFITWIGDDDLVKPGALEYLKDAMIDDADISLAYGGCEYIDSTGGIIGVNRSGPWALKLSRVGPFLAPQPGSLFRKKLFEQVGGLDASLQFAFDYDLFLRMASTGKVKHFNRILASFRWHSDSLSVRNRKSSVLEASKVRTKHAKGIFRPLVFAMNPLVSFTTLVSGTVVSRMMGKSRS